MSAFLLLAAVHAAAAGHVVICVTVDEAGLKSGAALSAAELRQALAARIGKAVTVVSGCDPKAEPASWRVLAVPQRELVAISIRGAGSELRKRISIEGLDQHQAAQVVALAVAETIRPSLRLPRLPEAAPPTTPEPEPTRQLAPLGLPSGPDAGDRPEPGSGGGAAVGDISRRAPTELGLELGGELPFASGRAAPHLRLYGSFSLGVLDPIGSVGFSEHLRRSRNLMMVGGEELHAAVGVGRRWQPVAVSVLGKGRRTSLRFDSPRFAGRVRRSYWDAGLGLGARAWVLDLMDFQLGVAADLTLWWRPRRVTFGGHEVFAQDTLSVFVAAAIAWHDEII
ncbi:MAG: hypothetical protein HY903_12625 [Deltaproteobacteria bacterium]|nr:hypothetical protein [Deltaproteobacteria bacterium]